MVKLKDKASARIREMLTKDKLGMSDGFMAAFKADEQHLVGDYFDIDDLTVKVEQKDDGKYLVSVFAVASKIKLFDTTFSR